MTRSMKFGMLTIAGLVVISLMAPDDAEARRRWRGRWRNTSYSYASNGCCGVPVSCCGVAAAPACPTGACGVATTGFSTGACGVASGACPGGVCDVTGGAYSGGYSAGYGTTAPGSPTLAPIPQGTHQQNGATQSAPPPAPNGGTLQQNQSLNGTAPSPSDRSLDQAPPPPTANGAAGAIDRSAPPPPVDQ
jgi:hypothetical protein